MAKVHTSLPTTHRGEGRLATQLSSLDDDKLHLWFGLDYLPDIRDIDVLIWHETAGVFVVEVKAVELDSVESFTLRRCKIAGRKESESPHYQAQGAMQTLINSFGPRMPDGRLPFMVATCCWPLITRAEWNLSWANELIIGDFAERMIFSEDISSGPAAFLDRLLHIWHHAPAKVGSTSQFTHAQDKLALLVKLLDDTPNTRVAAPSDLEKLHIIEEKVSRETLTEVPPDGGRRVHYYGYPGTGKTFRLLQIGVAHVLSGMRVLFVCFNKVLAADIHRILSNSRRLPISQEELRVADVFEIAMEWATGYERKTGDYDRWGEQVLEEMRILADDIAKFDTILIDEAQDMKDWALSMVELFASPGSTVCVASGTGQELYGETAQWLIDFSKSAARKRLNRNFRNTEPVGKLSQAFFEALPDKEKIFGVLSRYKENSTKGNQQLLFERTSVSRPSLLALREYPAEVHSDGSTSSRGFELLVAEYRQIIADQVKHLEDSERPIDLLILVPKYKSLQRAIAQRALNELNIPYIDYTLDHNRRHISPIEAVRLCTFYSSRGIEGNRVVVFGFDMLEEAVKETATTVNNLGYITLSRSSVELIIVTSPSIRSKTVKFVEHILAAMYKTMDV